MRDLIRVLSKEMTSLVGGPGAGTRPNRTVTSRLVAGTLANAIGKFWVLGLQFALIPALTAAWGAGGYGVWLMLTAVPTYIALSDFGFGSAAASDMTRNVASGRPREALRVFQSVWVLTSGVSGLLVAIAAALWLAQQAGRSPVRISSEVADAAMLLVAYSAVVVQSSLIWVGYRSTGRYAQGTFLLDIALPLEALGIMLVAWAGGGFVGAALLMLIVRVSALALYYAVLRRHEPWLSIGWSAASWSEIRRLAHPALATVNITLSSALSLQGLIIAIGSFGAPAIAGAFGAARTLTRAPLQLTGIIIRATAPELTTAHALEDRVLLDKLARYSLIVTAAISGSALVFLTLLGPWALRLLSNGQLVVSAGVFFCLGAAAAFQSGWTTIGQFLFAQNKQHKFAYFYLPLAGVTVISPLYVPGDMIVGVSLVYALAEAVMLVIVYRVWRKEEGARAVTPAPAAGGA